MDSEKRQFKRFVFPKSSRIRATLVPMSGEGTVEATILNVSQGGVGLAADKRINGMVSEEIEMLFQSVTEGTGLPCLKGEKVKIKWILNYEPLDNLGIGCEFVCLKDECLQQLNALFHDEK